jgi:hypothetical protein
MRFNHSDDLQEASNATLEILMAFDPTGVESYTFLVPNTMGGGKLPSLNSTADLAAADDIILAHILQGTIDFETIMEETSTGPWTVPSLQVCSQMLRAQGQGHRFSLTFHLPRIVTVQSTRVSTSAHCSAQ